MTSAIKPSVFKSILFALLLLLVQFLSYAVAHIVLSVIYFLLRIIPLLGDLLYWLTEEQGDGIAVIFPYFSLVFSYYFTCFTTERMSKHLPTQKLTFKISGICVIILHAIFFIANLSNISAWSLNIGFIIVGVAFIYKSNKIKFPTQKNETKSRSETIYYMESANGMTVRVPESRLEVWQAEQDKIRQGNKPQLTDSERKLCERILQEIYGSDSAESEE